ncbi:MAG: diguanylate cyclase [Planctomycetes bacterium]|nr:diguanylate cyclase [Planctomycetota bacterium]
MIKPNMISESSQKALKGSPRLLGQDHARHADQVFLGGWHGLVLGVACLALVAIIALLDLATGPELSFAIFYLVPIALAAWWGGFAQGILFSVACAVGWHFVEAADGSTFTPAIQLWNGTARFGIFIITSSLLSRLRLSLYLEKKLARSDPLTGAVNGRTFYEKFSLTIEHALRANQPLTLAYIDLDQFKWINDNLGHPVGDRLLCDLVRVVQENTRAIDLLARLGGDEFALLLTDCGEADARATLERIRERFVQETRKKKWPVTLSIGAATFSTPARDIDSLVRKVDELMYRAKKAGKNRVVHQNMGESVEVKAPSKLIERRATARVLCDRMARIRSRDDQPCHDEFARVRDISASGLCLFLESPMAENTLLAIEPLHECGAVTLVVRVMWSVEENGGWLHECVLPNRLTSEELRFWVNETTAESCHDCF